MERVAGCTRPARSAWFDDLATLAADALVRGRVRVPLALAALLLVGVTGARAPAFPLVTGLVAAALWERGRAAQEIRAARIVALAACVALVACQAPNQILGLLLIPAAFALAPLLRGGTSRRARIACLLVAVLAAGLARGTPLRGPAEFLCLAALVSVAASGRWALWTAIAIAVLTATRQWDATRNVQRLPHLDVAGPLLVVLAARTVAALRMHNSMGALAERADAGAAMLAARITHRPWRASMLVVPLAFLVSLDTFVSIEAASQLGVGGLETAYGFFALPGLQMLTVCVLFHALLRGPSPFAVAAPVVAPIIVSATLWVAIMAIETGGFTRSTSDTRAVLMIATGLGPMLPVLVGALVGRAAPRRAAVSPAFVAIVLTMVATVLPLPEGESLVERVFGVIDDARDRVHAMWILCLPALFAVHRLAASRASGRSLLAGGLGVAVAGGALLAVGGPQESVYFKGSVGVVTSAERAAFGVAALLALTAVMTVAAIVLARRFRELTPLPEDHPVLYWREALAADDARHEGSQ